MNAGSLSPVSSPFGRLGAAWVVAVALSVSAGAATVDIPALQHSITNGQAAQAVSILATALEKDPDNARLLYDHGVALYAAGQ